MINLIRAELQRLLHRRVTLVAGIGLLAIVAIFMVVVNVTVTPPSAAESAQAQSQFQQAHDDWEANGDQYVQECVDRGEGDEEQCTTYYPEPQVSNFVRQPTAFADAAPIAVQYGSLLAMMVIFIVGASFMGAEYGSGALANWLTFVPERLKVLGSKLIAIALCSAVALAVVNALAIAISALLVRIHGGAVEQVGDIVEIGARSVALGVLAGVLGLCLAMLTRHTVAALGILLGYLVASSVLGGLTAVIPALSKLPPWLPQNNISAFQQDGTTYYIYPEISANVQEVAEPIEKTITLTHGSIYLAVVLVVIVVLTGLVFRRRDVT